jgi:hypothetical protein
VEDYLRTGSEHEPQQPYRGGRQIEEANDTRSCGSGAARTSAEDNDDQLAPEHALAMANLCDRQIATPVELARCRSGTPISRTSSLLPSFQLLEHGVHPMSRPKIDLLDTARIVGGIALPATIAPRLSS